MAEVLITLAIIGVVAAITIPSIVANHKKRVLETQFVKAYRTLTQAVNLAIAEHGDIGSWDWKETYTTEEMDEFVKKYFIPYLNVAKHCPSGTEGCFTSATYTFLDGSMRASGLNKTELIRTLLADGSAIMFSFATNCFSTKGRCITLDIDTNGTKKPNQTSRDFFSFGLYPQTNEFLPLGVNIEATYDEIKGSFTKYTKEKVYASCTDGQKGGTCPARMVLDGFKMNY